VFPIPDALAAFYLICFWVGLLFVVASFFLGLTHDILHLPGLSHGHGGELHTGGMETHTGDLSHGAGSAGGTHAVGTHGEAGHGGSNNGALHAAGHEGLHGGQDASDEHAGGSHVSPFNVSTVMAFLTWFGGAGYILRVYEGVTGVFSVTVATLAGLVGGTVIFFFLARVLLPGQRFLNPADYRMEGTVATVTMPIEPGQTGEIIYTQGGTRHSDGARSADGKPIEHGTEVVIVRYERGIAYVEPWKSFVAKG
jgi:membrane protein implicated in regulation of membrane protease activity